MAGKAARAKPAAREAKGGATPGKAGQQPAAATASTAGSAIAGRLPRTATSIAAAAIVVALALIARTLPDIVAHGRGGGVLGALRAGACDFGAPDRPGDVQVLDVAELGGLRLPAGIRCPVVLRGLPQLPAWGDLARLGDLRELERRTPSSVSFDASTNGEFAYWDNQSLLAAKVRQLGVIRQGYVKTKAPRKAFFAALKAEAPGSSTLGSVRYGGKLEEFSRDAARALGSHALALTPDGPSASAPSLWLSAAGSFSTAHYDSFHNVFVMLGGEKQMLLSPAADAHLFHIYPGVHPLARQARLHFGRPDAGTGKAPEERQPSPSQVPAEARVLSARLRGGEALFIPAGWLHHVVAHETAVSLALTSLPQEHHDFNAWMVEGGGAVLPFVVGTGGDWTTRRLAAALRVFTPALLRAVQFSAGGPRQDMLDVLVNVSYGLETRAEFGLPAKLPAYRPCDEPSSGDRRAAEAAARQVAARFNSYQEDLRGLYIIPYLETALSRVAGSERDAARIMHKTMGFVQTCMLAP